MHWISGMRTEVEYRDDQKLIIRTVIRRSDWYNSDFRKMTETYHAVRSAQALEAAIENGYKHIGNEVIGREYWEDAQLACLDEMLVYTIFRIKHKRDLDA